MKFLELLDEQAKEKNWLNFFLTLVEFLLNEKLEWNLNNDGCFSDSFKAFLPKKFFSEKENINGEPKVIISIIKDDDIQGTISIKYRENFNLMAIFCLCLTEETKTELHGFYKQEKIEAVVIGKENELVKLKFKNLHNKLIRLRLNKT